LRWRYNTVDIISSDINFAIVKGIQKAISLLSVIPDQKLDNLMEKLDMSLRIIGAAFSHEVMELLALSAMLKEEYLALNLRALDDFVTRIASLRMKLLVIKFCLSCR
jgi:hypothetical protein